MSAGVCTGKGKEAAFSECAGKIPVTDLSGVVILSAVGQVKCFGEDVLLVWCGCKGVQKESEGSCDLLLSPGEVAVICPLFFHPPGPRLASGDARRPKMQRSGFFGRAGFSGERSFLGLPGLQAPLLCFKSLHVVESLFAASFHIPELFLSFACISFLLSDICIVLSLSDSCFVPERVQYKECVFPCFSAGSVSLASGDVVSGCWINVFMWFWSSP